jgi:hypothetical protein
MVKRNGIRKSYYYLAILILISTVKILPQDNTNNNMVNKSTIPENILEKKIKQNANYYSYILHTSLNLTNSQTKYIYDLLVGYYSNETGVQTTQQAALREDNKQYSNIEQDPLMKDNTDIKSDPLMKDTTNIKSDPLMQNENNLATTTNFGSQQENVSDEVLTKIGGVLDNDQMIKWAEIKNGWWGKANTMTSETNLNLNDTRFYNNEKAEYDIDRDYENYDVYYPGYDFK